MFAANQTTDGRRKDTVVNAEETGEFVYNMVTYELREAVNLSAQQVPPGVDEFELAGVTKVPSNLVKAPRAAESPVQFECLYHQTIRLPGNSKFGTVNIIIGRVIGVHIKDEFIQPNGKLDILKIRPIGRLGYYDYTSIESFFEMIPPHADKKFLSGLEGRKGE
jgi:flavin reductase (DIM6/NTAB) family NADH-FMN oxidoreductase RutF